MIKFFKILGVIVLILIVIWIIIVKILFPTSFQLNKPKYIFTEKIQHSKLKQPKKFEIEIEEDFEYGLSSQITYIFQGKEFNYKNFHKNYKNLKAQEEHKMFNDLLCVEINETNSCNLPNVKYRTIVKNKASKKIIVDEVISNPYTSASYYGRWAILSKFNLKKGKYTVIIKTIESNADLDKLSLEIGVQKSHHGK